MGLIVAGAASTGGLAALALKVSRKKNGATENCPEFKSKEKIKMSTSMIENPKIVSRDEWLAARKELLAKEKRSRASATLSPPNAASFPGVKVEKNYVFDGPNGKVTLADLFNGKSQLIIYLFMFGPDWQEGCPSCSFNMDHTDGRAGASGAT